MKVSFFDLVKRVNLYYYGCGFNTQSLALEQINTLTELGLIKFQFPAPNCVFDCIINLTDKGFEYLLTRLHTAHKANQDNPIRTYAGDTDNLCYFHNRKLWWTIEDHVMSKQQVLLLSTLIEDYLFVPREYDNQEQPQSPGLSNDM